MSKKLLIIGGGKWQVPIIKKAKELGHYVICSNLYEDSIGFKYSDVSYVVDVLDKEKNLQIAKKHNVDAILTDQSDIAVITVAYLSDQLGLKGVGNNIAHLFTNKRRMREELIVSDLHHPKFKICKTIEEANHFFTELKRPIVIKPLSNQSSRGVFKIETIKKLHQKFELTLKHSINNSILVEEYIGGIEVTVEGFKSENKHYTLAISKKEHYEKLSSVAKSLIYLDKHNEFNSKKLKTINNKLFDKLNFGITHVEYKYYNEKFYLIEAAIRGGGTKISSHIIPIVSGVNVNALLIKILLNEKDVDIKLSNKKKCVILKFFDFQAGKVSKIYGTDYMTECPFILDFDFEFKEGDIIKMPSDDRSRIGYFIAYAESKKNLMKIVHNIDEKVYLDYV